MFGNKKPKRPLTVTDTIDDAHWFMLTFQEQLLLFVIERRQLGRTDDIEFQVDLAEWRRQVRFSVGLGTTKERNAD